MMPAVYVLHLHPPFKHARHYIGFTDGEDVGARIAEHEQGRGSRLIRAATRAGCRAELAHVFVGADRHFERRLKRRKDVCTWCRICGSGQRPTPSIGGRG